MFRGEKSQRSVRKKKTKKSNDEVSQRRKKSFTKKKGGPSQMKKKKDKGEASQLSVDTVIEGGSSLEKRKTKKEAWSGDDVAKRLVGAGLFNADTIASDFKALKEPKPSGGECDKFQAAKSRQPDCPIANDKLIKLSHAPDNFINAARVSIPEFKRTALIAQLPDVSSPANIEDFWRLIFQEEILAMVIALAPQEGSMTLQQFLPAAAGSFANHGKMFLNNKKVDSSVGVTMYNIEILPDGCSNSIHCHVYHIPNWKQKKGCDPVGDLVATVEKIIKTNENTAFVSLNGVGRAGTVMTLFGVMLQIQKESKDVKVKETLEKLRAERCGIVENLDQYQTIHKSLALWFKNKSSDDDVLKKANDYAPNVQ
uniref:Tyrosine-protein phosphatase domain-containing protein n=1 Tax=Caenorhabditis japonica TaxID=281687 RepID=A0A8R1HWW0_CAEJA